MRVPGWNRRRCAAAAGVLLAAIMGCTDRSGAPQSAAETDATEPLLVLAAASVEPAMNELIQRFEARTGVPIDLVLGATGNLAAQIENGAPADLFFSADETTVERLVASGAMRPASVRPYAVGELAVVWGPEVTPPASLTSLAAPEYEVIAIANPELAPYGAAAREALQRLAVWERVEPRIVQGENIAQAYQILRTRNADVAIVARSILAVAGENYLLVDPALHAPIRHAAGILERTRHPQAEPFFNYVLSPEGESVLVSHGFGSAQQ